MLALARLAKSALGWIGLLGWLFAAIGFIFCQVGIGLGWLWAGLALGQVGFGLDLLLLGWLFARLALVLGWVGFAFCRVGFLLGLLWDEFALAWVSFGLGWLCVSLALGCICLSRVGFLLAWLLAA